MQAGRYLLWAECVLAVLGTARAQTACAVFTPVGAGIKPAARAKRCVGEGEKLKTGVKTSGLLKLPGGTRIKLAPLTEAVLPRGEERPWQPGIHLVKGKLWVAPNASRRPLFVVSTPQAWFKPTGYFAVKADEFGSSVETNEGPVLIVWDVWLKQVLRFTEFERPVFPAAPARGITQAPNE